MSEHNLDDLIRVVNPDTFSATAHGAGHRIVSSDDEVSIHKPSLLGKWLGKRNARHCFVKVWSVPKEVGTWTFRWSEGTNAVSLDFSASFVIQANEDLQAMTLAKILLRKTDDAGEALYGIINARLREQLSVMLRRCDERTVSLLDEFRRSSIGVGESDALNRTVTEAVRVALPGVDFRIGFQLKNAPPMQIEVRQTDEFTLADSKLPRKAETTALLHLDNYQTYKKSGLETEAAVKATIARAISQSVKHLLFAQKYYAVVKSFQPGDASIARQMERSIQADAQAIGYRVKMFQTFSDIAALKLLEPMRIDIQADDDKDKYYLVNSTGYVQVSLAMSVRVADDFSKLHLLIEPDEPRVAAPIIARVRQLCRDTIQRFDRMAFNLEFDQVIVPALRGAIVGGLGAYGLIADVINVVQVPTEEATRFMAIRGRTIDFKAEIAPHADDGDGEPVQVVGAIEVVGMTQSGWPQFESKDFGFRQDSLWSEARLRQQADARGVALPTRTPMPREDRRAVAIELELADIRERVVGVLEGSMSMGPELARHWTSWKTNQEISEWGQEMAEQAIVKEFGLKVALRGFRRLDTQAEATLRIQRTAKHEQLREVSKEMARKEIEHQEALRGVVNDNQLELLKRYAQLEHQALSDDADPQHERVRERIALETQRVEAEQRRIGLDAAAVLPARHAREPSAAASTKQLPWQRGARAGDTGAGVLLPAERRSELGLESAPDKPATP